MGLLSTPIPHPRGSAFSSRSTKVIRPKIMVLPHSLCCGRMKPLRSGTTSGLQQNNLCLHGEPGGTADRRAVQDHHMKIKPINLAILRQHYESGSTLAQLGVAYGFSTTGIYDLLKKTGVTMRRRGPNGGVNAHHHLRKVPSEQLPAIIARLKSGELQTSIAAEFHVTHQCISLIMLRAGITSRRKSKYK